MEQYCYNIRTNVLHFHQTVLFFDFFILFNPSIESRARIAAARNVSYFASCTRTNLGCVREGPNVRFESDKSEL